jgi:hypothetical protein
MNNFYTLFLTFIANIAFGQVGRSNFLYPPIVSRDTNCQSACPKVWIVNAAGNYTFKQNGQPMSVTHLMTNRVMEEQAYLPNNAKSFADWMLRLNNPTVDMTVTNKAIPNIQIVAPYIGQVNTLSTDTAYNYEVRTIDADADFWMLDKMFYTHFMSIPINQRTPTISKFLAQNVIRNIDTFYRLKQGFDSLRIVPSESVPVLIKQLQQLNACISLDKENFDIQHLEKQKQLFIICEKIVNELYLSQISKPKTAFTEQEQAILCKIATLCPLIAGEAPMKACALYKHFVNPMSVLVSNCDTITKVMIKKSVHLVQFKIYPNPSNGLVYLMSEIDAPLTWELHTTDGRLIASGTMKGKMDVLDATSLTNGLYFLKVIEEGQLRTTLKIAITK